MGSITVNFYRTYSHKERRRLYRFRVVAANGLKLANSGEGYVNLVDAEAAARLFTRPTIEFTYTGIPSRVPSESLASFNAG